MTDRLVCPDCKQPMSSSHGCPPIDTDKVQARLDAALDALAECRKKRDYYREKAREWRDNYYRALRGEHVHDVPMEEPTDE